MARKDDLGRWGERIAGEFLVTNGYEILDRGWRCRLGEIDLVVRREDTIAFVEVKTRRGLAYGHPLEAVTLNKLTRLRVLAGEWCRDHQTQIGHIRIDAIGIVGDGHSIDSLDHRVGVMA